MFVSRCAAKGVGDYYFVTPPSVPKNEMESKNIAASEVRGLVLVCIPCVADGLLSLSKQNAHLQRVYAHIIVSLGSGASKEGS